MRVTESVNSMKIEIQPSDSPERITHVNPACDPGERESAVVGVE